MRQKLISGIMTAVIGLMTALSARAFQVTEITPANRTEVSSLSTITLKLDEPLGEWQPEPYALKIGNAPLTYDAIVHTVDNAEEIVITVEPELDIPGTYEIVIPRESVWNQDFEYLPETSLIYVVSNGNTPPEDMVCYDMTYSSVTPQAGRVDTAIKEIVLGFDEEIFVMEESEDHYVRGRLYGDNGMVISNGRLEKTDDKTVTVRLSNTVSAKGKYTFLIEKGVIGDAAWNADNSKGHANKEISVSYNHMGTDSAEVVDADRPVVRTYGGTVTVDGAEAGISVEMYTISGSTVYKGKTASSQTVIDGLPHGVYMLKIGNIVQKVVLKQ